MGDAMFERAAVVLLSGGLDSTTTLAIANAEGFDSYALSFRYGQRHIAELAAAAFLAMIPRAVESAKSSRLRAHRRAQTCWPRPVASNRETISEIVPKKIVER